MTTRSWICFVKKGLDLELQAIRETRLLRDLAKGQCIRAVVGLVGRFAGVRAGMFAGLNTMYGSVIGRTAELSTLRTMGYLRRAIVISLIQEGVLMALGASLLPPYWR